MTPRERAKKVLSVASRLDADAQMSPEWMSVPTLEDVLTSAITDAIAAERARFEQPCTWAVNQMRRAARTLELVEVGATLPADNFYSKGLDMCADALEKLVSP